VSPEAARNRADELLNTVVISIRRADLAMDRGIIIEVLARYLTPLSDDRRFQWLYLNGVHGTPQAWLAVDADRDAVCGAAAAFPRRFHLGNEEILSWVLGDFCLDPQYRSLGPALQLQRACLGVMEQNPAAFCYDFPSASMVAVYKRLGLSVTGKMLRLAKPLRVDRKVKERITNPAARRVFSSVANAFLKIALPNGTADKTLEMSTQKEPCGDEFTALMHEQRGKFEICLQRSAEYLNWRYVNNPLTSYEIITARRHGKLKGYVVWTKSEEDAAVVDLFGENNPAIVKTLLAEVVARLTNCGVMTVSLWLTESHPWLSWCSEMGFRARDSVPMVCIPGTVLGGSIDVRSAKWFLMQGDRDS